MTNTLCTSCNTEENYYHKSNDELNTGSFYQCYHTSEVLTDYYLDNSAKVFKPCYYACNKCNIGAQIECFQSNCTHYYNQ